MERARTGGLQVWIQLLCGLEDIVFFGSVDQPYCMKHGKTLTKQWQDSTSEVPPLKNLHRTPPQNRTLMEAEERL